MSDYSKFMIVPGRFFPLKVEWRKGLFDSWKLAGLFQSYDQAQEYVDKMKNSKLGVEQ